MERLTDGIAQSRELQRKPGVRKLEEEYHAFHTKRQVGCQDAGCYLHALPQPPAIHTGPHQSECMCSLEWWVFRIILSYSADVFAMEKGPPSFFGPDKEPAGSPTIARPC